MRRRIYYEVLFSVESLPRKTVIMVVMIMAVVV